jgi:hypothetical protein
MIDGMPEIIFHAGHHHADLVEIPAPIPECSHRLDATLPGIRSEYRFYPPPPELHRLERNGCASRLHQVFEGPERLQVGDMHQSRDE